MSLQLCLHLNTFTINTIFQDMFALTFKLIRKGIHIVAYDSTEVLLNGLGEFTGITTHSKPQIC